jgi:phosphoribosylamine--glycine ligase
MTVPRAEVLHALTEPTEAGPRSRGGRVLNVLGKGPSVYDAREAAYRAIEAIRIGGELPRFRRDVGLTTNHH